jgi:hypothetical protein
VDKEIRRDSRCVSFVLFIFSALLLTGCASAQCGDCDDKNPCTMDLCDAMSCKHTPQSCDDANSSALALSGKGVDINTTQRESLGQNWQKPSVFVENVNIPASCDDNNPCTRDSNGENGCVHDPVSCDDGNASTIDTCGSSGCVNTPLPGESYSVEFLSPVLPEIQNMAATENTTINGSQTVLEETIAQPITQPICDDGNPCTTDADNGTGCDYALMNCDDGNDSTLDSCRDGACINEPINGGSIISENGSNSPSSNNSTVLSSSEKLVARHHPRCEDMNCDDGNPDTFDYCFEGVCYNTTKNCDDKKPCTYDSFNGTECVYTRKRCYDSNPCTKDYCDPVRGCQNPLVVCAPGKTCIHGVCQYLHYPYAAPYFLYYPYYPYVAPASTIPSAQSYTIPSGTAITLPWTKSVTALNTLKVENGIAYSGASPLRFVISLGLEDQAVSGNQTGLPISERAEMIGLSWKDGGFTLTLIQPDGSTLPVQGDNRNVMHLVGLNYNYYFLRGAAIGNWSIEVMPINPGANGVGFSLITGLVKGAVPIIQP